MSKKFRHPSGHRDSTDVESDASESLILSSTEHSVSMDSECDTKESPSKDSSAMEVQSDCNNSIIKTEADHSEGKCSCLDDGIKDKPSDGMSGICDSQIKNGESDVMISECSDSVMDMQSRSLVSNSTECVTDEVMCDSQNTACDMLQTITNEEADSDPCVSSGTVDSSLVQNVAGNSGSGFEEQSDDEVSCGRMTKDTSVQDNVCSSNNVESCSATVENTNVCDSVSHIVDEKTDSQCDESLHCVSSTGEDVGSEIDEATSCVHSADSVNVPDSQSENLEQIDGDELQSADSGFENLSGVSSTCVMESVQDISQSSAASVTNLSQSAVLSDGTTESEPQPSVQSMASCTLEDTSLAPTKKKVSSSCEMKAVKTCFCYM